MKLSYYNYVLKGKTKNIIWNTLSGAVIKFDKKTYKQLEKLQLEKNQIKILKDNGIIVDNNVDENKKILLVKEKKNTNKNTVTFTIALTEGCNAKCYYCYQIGNCTTENREVTQNDYDNILNFIVEQSKGKKIKIVWFGGEPLLKKDIILYICNKLKEKNLDYTSNIITNGLLLYKFNINQLIDIVKIEKIQITFDGLYNKHNIRKGFHQDIDQFKLITNNMITLLENNIKINIRVNISLINKDELSDIIEYFTKKYGRYKNFKIYYELITEDPQINDYAILTKEREKFVEELFNKNMKIDELKKILYLPKRRTHFCGAQSNDAYFMDIYGNLYVCEHHIWNRDKIISNISNFDKEKYLKLKNTDSNILSNKCKKCVFLPVCQGGCIKEKINECPLYIFNAKQKLKYMLEDERR